MEDEKKKMCPILQGSQCMESDCAWWVTYYQGTKNEASECAIKALGCLADMI